MTNFMTPAPTATGRRFGNLPKRGLKIIFYLHKSNCLEVFCKKVVLQNFVKFIGIHLSQGLFLISCIFSPHLKAREMSP